VVVECEDVWREISNYFEGDIDPALKHLLEEHFVQCPHCQSVRDGVRNVIDLYGDNTMLTLPAGLYSRLRDRLADQVGGQKVSRRAWLVSVGVTGALAASALLVAAFDRFEPQPRAKMSQSARRLQQRLVAIVDGGKTFHVPGCPFMHGKYHLVTAEEAVRKGYVPCNRCMYEALRSVAIEIPDFEERKS
jgi:hypothetical protein